MVELKRVKQSTFDIVNALIDGQVVYLEDDTLSAFFGVINDRVVVNGFLGMTPLRQFFSRIKVFPTLISSCSISVVLTNENLKDYYVPSDVIDEGLVNVELLKNDLKIIFDEGINQGLDKEPLIITKKELEDMLDLATKPTDTEIM